MKLLFLLFLIIHTQAIPQNSLPNVEFVGRGIDMLKGDPVMNSLRGPALQLTWSENNTQKLNGLIYSIPDNFYLVPAPASQSGTIVQVYTSSSSISEGLYQSQSQAFGGLSFKGIKLIPGMYSRSAQASYFSQQSAQQYYTAYSYLEVESWKVGVSPFAQFNISYFSTNFLTWLKKLPPIFNTQTCPVFKNFISLYGTHFIPEVLWGGQVTMQTTYSKIQYDSIGDSAVQSDIGKQFYLSTQKSLTSTQQQQLSTLNAMYTSTTHLVGGDPSKYKPNDWPQWAFSVPNNPVPISMLLVPYFSLIGSQYYETSLGNNGLQKAIETYLSPPDHYATLPPYYEDGIKIVNVYDKLYYFYKNKDYRNGWQYFVSGYIYDSSNDTWSNSKMFNKGYDILLDRSYATTNINNIFYVMDSIYSSGECMSTQDPNKNYTSGYYLYHYDILTNNTIKMDCFNDISSNAVMAMSSNFLYIIGKYNSVVYDIKNNKYSLTPYMINKNYQYNIVDLGSTVTVGDLLYVICSNSAYYNPATNSWTIIANMTKNRQKPALYYHDDFIYAVGGDMDFKGTIERYNIKENVWQIVTNFPDGMVKNRLSMLVDNIIYIIASDTRANLYKFERYDLVNNVWNPLRAGIYDWC